MGEAGGATIAAQVGFVQLGAKTLMVAASPAFGMIALAGVVGWQLWKAKKDAKEIEAKKAAAGQTR